MLTNADADLKLVKPQNILITLRFLGSISLPMVDSIHEEMKKITFTLFEMELRALVAFPS